MKAIALKSIRGLLTQNEEYDVVDQIGDNTIVICDDGSRIGFGKGTLKVIEEFKRTALKISIDRKRTKLMALIDGAGPEQSRQDLIDLLKAEIVEDEKLLMVERRYIEDAVEVNYHRPDHLQYRGTEYYEETFKHQIES
jgi:hypothetical protein